MKSRRVVSALLFICLISGLLFVPSFPILRADDIITLESGQKVKGIIVSEDVESIKIRLFSTGTVASYFWEDIEDVKRGKDPKKEYKSRLKKAIDKNTADAFCELGIWVKIRVPGKEKNCFKKALKLDPLHEKTRKALGQHFHEGNWLTRKEWKIIEARIKAREKPKKEPEPEPEPEPTEEPDPPTTDKPDYEDGGLPSGKLPPGHQAALKPFKDEAAEKAWIDQIKVKNKFTLCHTTKYYYMFTSGSKANAQLYGKMMDKMFKEYKKIFQYKDELTRKLPVFLYKNQQEFMSATRKGRNIGGFFDGRRIVGFLGSMGGGLNTQSVLCHEGTHQFQSLMLPNMLQKCDKIGMWLIEGLAVFFEATQFRKGKIRTGIIPQNRLRQIRGAIATGRAHKLRALLTWPKSRFSANEYSHAWSFIYFLGNYKKAKYRKKFIEMWKYTKKHQELPPEKIEEIIGVPLDKLERQWYSYVRRGCR